MIIIQRQAKKFRCNMCFGEFVLTVVKDSRKYIPYQYCCPFCGADVDSGLNQGSEQSLLNPQFKQIILHLTSIISFPHIIHIPPILKKSLRRDLNPRPTAHLGLTHTRQISFLSKFALPLSYGGLQRINSKNSLKIFLNSLHNPNFNQINRIDLIQFAFHIPL